MGGSTLIAPHKSALRKAERQGTPGMRRAVALVLWLVLPGMGALAQDFPVRTVRIISPTGPGGGTDILARLLAQKLGASLGQAVVVEHRPGANGIIGTAAFKNLPADGHAILMTSPSLAANAALYKDLPYDYQKDFVPVAMGIKSTYYFVTRADGPFKTVDDLVRFARANPSKVNFSSSAQALSQRIGIEIFNNEMGLRMTHVQYKTQPEALRALVSGEVHLANVGLPAVGGLVKQGSLRLIAVGAPVRSRNSPDVPTMEQAGGPRGFQSNGWIGFVTHAAVPAPALEKLRQHSVAALRDAEIVAFTEKNDFALWELTPAEMTRAIEADARRYFEVIKAIGLQGEGS